MLFSEVSFLMWLPITALVVVGLARIAGVTRETWFDPSVASALSLWGTALALHGVFIAGASTFGPIEELDVGADPEFNGGVYLYSNVWKTSYERGQRIESQLELAASLPDTFTAGDVRLYDSCIDYCMKHNKDVFPIHIQVSTWDSHIHWMRFNHVDPPVTIGTTSSRFHVRPIIELALALVLWRFAYLSWKEGRRRKIRFHVEDPFSLLKEMDEGTRSPG